MLQANNLITIQPVKWNENTTIAHGIVRTDIIFKLSGW